MHVAIVVLLDVVDIFLPRNRLEVKIIATAGIHIAAVVEIL